MNEYMKRFRLDGKSAWVSGGLGLIGTQITLALLEAGAEVTVLDIDEARFNTVFDGSPGRNRLHFRKIDLTDLNGISTQFDQMLESAPCPAVFVNCSYPRTPDWGRSTFADITVDSLRKNVDMHLNSYLWSAREIAERMVKSGGEGSIILLGSTYGIVGQDLNVYDDTPMGENMTYSAIKGGIANYCRLMASYYGVHKIRVNCLCPGGIFDNQNPVFVSNYEKQTPMKRMGGPDEIASTALFLASEAASYVSGATIMVDGGWTAV